jgi:hypothetical protein
MFSGLQWGVTLEYQYDEVKSFWLSSTGTSQRHNPSGVEEDRNIIMYIIYE